MALILCVRCMLWKKKDFNFDESTLKNGQLTAWSPIKGLSACKSDPFGWKFDSETTLKRCDLHAMCCDFTKCPAKNIHSANILSMNKETPCHVNQIVLSSNKHLMWSIHCDLQLRRGWSLGLDVCLLGKQWGTVHTRGTNVTKPLCNLQFQPDSY